MTIKRHWTEDSPEDFVFYIASDFIERLEEEMQSSGITKKMLAERLKVSAGRVSQIFHNPGNLTLEMIVRCARAVGIKVAMLAYNDGDKDNLNGPIIPDVFYACWEKCGSPKNMFQVDKAGLSYMHFSELPIDKIATSVEMTEPPRDWVINPLPIAEFANT